VIERLEAGVGGRVCTLNTDRLRVISRDVRLEPIIRDSSLIVADGMPLVWAAALARTPLPERVTGSSLIFTLSEAAAREGRSVYLLGAEPDLPQRAAVGLTRRYPSLSVLGTGFVNGSNRIDAIRGQLIAEQPDIVYAGLGFPTEEHLICELAPSLPSTWFLGCGGAMAYAAGLRPRAPRWIQDLGFEWLFRIATEPSVWRRYLIDGLPFALGLLARSAASGLAGSERVVVLVPDPEAAAPDSEG
jgi:N-acetylglucosaminyldiphosphoundecaprenol N-acetyl-beta-D-mannosaminyltransferase